MQQHAQINTLRHALTFKDLHTWTHTVKTYIDAQTKIDMHRYALTCKNMHISIRTHMQEHSSTSTDQHEQIYMHRHAQACKNRPMFT